MCGSVVLHSKVLCFLVSKACVDAHGSCFESEVTCQCWFLLDQTHEGLSGIVATNDLIFVCLRLVFVEAFFV